MLLTLAVVTALGCLLPAGAAAIDPSLASAIDHANETFRAGDLDTAIAMLESARGDGRQRLGADHPDNAEVAARLALFHLYRNDADRAAELAEEALAIREEAFGPVHEKVAASLVDLASIRLVQGQASAAGRLYSRVVDIWTSLVGPDDARTVQARSNLIDFYEGQGRAAEAHALRSSSSADRAPTSSPGLTPPPCPAEPAELGPPAWDTTLAEELIEIALKREKQIALALETSVHHFAEPPPAAHFELVLGPDAATARRLAVTLRERISAGDESAMTLLALVRAARERLLVGDLERLSGRTLRVYDYHTAVASVRWRALVGVVRFDITGSPFAELLTDTGRLLAKRIEIARLIRRTGFDVNNEVKFRPEFLACVALRPLVVGYDYQALRSALEVIWQHGDELDAFLRFAGVDTDAALKLYARSLAERSGSSAKTTELGDGVSYDRRNEVVYVDAHPASLAVHLDASSRDPRADVAGLVSQWEHGGFPDVSRRCMEKLVHEAAKLVPSSALADFLSTIELDLRTRYVVEPTAEVQDRYTWTRPRVGYWQNSQVGRHQRTTYYDLGVDTLGTFSVPPAGGFIAKRLDSPVGMVIAVGVERMHLPVATLGVLSSAPATLHVIVVPDEGLEYELYAHPDSLDRQPGVEPIAAGATPLKPPPVVGWSIHPFANLEDPAVDSDHVLLDVRPIPGVLPGQPKDFRLHACLLAPLEVSNEGTQVQIRSPIWRERTDIPDTALFAVYRRKKGQGDGAWTEIAGQLLSFKPTAGYAFDRVSELRVVGEGMSLQLAIDDRTGDPNADYEYRVEHRCALDANSERSKREDDDLAPAFEILEIEHATERALLCDTSKGSGGAARPWVRVSYRILQPEAARLWNDDVTVLDPDGEDMVRRDAVTVRRESSPVAYPVAADTSAQRAGREYSLWTSVTTCNEGPYRFHITLEAGDYRQEVSETLYVRVD